MSEKRKLSRHRTLKPGTIAFKNGGAISCTVRNVSLTLKFICAGKVNPRDKKYPNHPTTKASMAEPPAPPTQRIEYEADLPLSMRMRSAVRTVTSLPPMMCERAYGALGVERRFELRAEAPRASAPRWSSDREIGQELLEGLTSCPAGGVYAFIEDR